MRAHSHAKMVLLAFAAFAAVLSVSATQVMHRPSNYKDTPNKYKVGNASAHVIHKRAGAKVQAAYFTNWFVLPILVAC